MLEQKTTKQCSKCTETKTLNNFSGDKTKKDGLCFWCRECRAKYRKDRTLQRNRKYDLHSKYRITQSEYDKMLIDQKGVCYICKKPETRIHYRTGTIQPLCVDHDHKTGKIRKLLCTECNLKVGYVEINYELLMPAINYIEEMKD